MSRRGITSPRRARGRAAPSTAPAARGAPEAGRRKVPAAPQRVAIGLVLNANRILVGRRPRPPLAGCAEFPGGKVAPGETPRRAVAREVREECGLDVRVDRLHSRTRARYGRDVLDLHFFLCRPNDRRPPRPRPPFRWVAVEQLSALRFPEANAGVLADLAEGAALPHGRVKRRRADGCAKTPTTP